MTYSKVEDLLTGDLPLPPGIDAGRYVLDASDEIDSKIGHIYVTPIDISDTSPVSRPARLLLKRIANHLASGRLLMALHANNQRLEVNAYAERLIREATESLNLIMTGDIKLDGGTLTDPENQPVTTPLINNLDPESNVEAFYDRIVWPTDPIGVYAQPLPDWESMP